MEQPSTVRVIAPDHRPLFGDDWSNPPPLPVDSMPSKGAMVEPPVDPALRYRLHGLLQITRFADEAIEAISDLSRWLVNTGDPDRADGLAEAARAIARVADHYGTELEIFQP